MPTDKGPESEKTALCPLRRHKTPCCRAECAWWRGYTDGCSIKAIALELAAREVQ